MHRQELEERINELIREYYKNQDPKIVEQILELGKQLRSWTSDAFSSGDFVLINSEVSAQSNSAKGLRS